MVFLDLGYYFLIKLPDIDAMLQCNKIVTVCADLVIPKKALISFLLILPAVTVHGQQRVYYEHYSTNDGLSHGSVVNMMKDSRGFMWFSTWDGLNRFDGVNFKTFKTMPGDNINLSSNRIREMLEDPFNAIWLKSYDSKIFRLDLETERFDNAVGRINDSLTGDIQSLCLSSDSNLWLATRQDGLYRIVTDPVTRKITIYHYNAGADGYLKIPDNHINLIFEDAGQNIWFTSKKGITELNRSENFSVEALVPDLKKIFNNYEFTCWALREDEIILGTNDGTLIFYDPVDHHIHKTSISRFPVTSVLVDKNGIYAGINGDGLYEINGLTGQIEYRYYTGFIHAVHSIYKDSHGLLWLETNAGGAVKVDPEDHSVKLFTQKVDVENVRHVTSHCQFVEADDVLWMSMKGGGFGYYDRDNDKLNYFYNEPGNIQSKMSNFVYCFYVDAANILWLSTYRKGIEKFTLLNYRFSFKAPDPGSENYLSNEVRTVFEDHSGMLWLSTKSGDLYLLDKDYHIISNFTKAYNLGSPLVYSIFEDNDQNIWLGTKGDGIYKISRRENGGFSFRHFRHEKDNIHSLSDNNIYSIEQDNAGNIWIGTYGGGLNLLEFRNGKYLFKSGDQLTGYPTNGFTQIRQIRKDSKGNLWLATTEGLLFFNPQKKRNGDYRFLQFRKKINDVHSLGNNDVYCIYQDQNDTLWFGTLGGGLQKLIRYPASGITALFDVFTKKNGLSSDVIFSIESDRDNNLWMSSENGIIKYNTRQHLFRNYNEYDGISTASFSEAASAKRKNGDLVFGTYNGIYYFKPDRITEEKEKTNLYFTGLKVLNKAVTVANRKGILGRSMVFTKRIELKFNQNIFELSFAALDYKATSKLRYSYKLEGFDNHWRQSQIGNAVYTKVPPGEYTFQVRLLDPEIVLRTPCTLQIIIKKPYLKTDLAYAIYIFLILLILFFAQRILITMLRLRNKVIIEKQISDLKINFFTNISHELRTPLTLIQGPVQEIYNNEKLSEKGKEYIELINLNTERMLKLVNQLLDFRKIQNKKMQLKLTLVSFDIFTEQICNNFTSLANEKKIEFSLDLKVRDIKVWLDEEKMDIVIFNLLSNAFKFTPSGKRIQVVLEKERDRVILSVHDQGIGISDSKKKFVFQRFSNIHDPSEIHELSTGLGLSLSRELMELHKGSIYFKSEKGKGTTFFMELKMGRDHFDRDLVSFPGEEKITVGSESKTDLSIETEENNGVITKNGSRENLLIVEDNQELRKFMRDILSVKFAIYEAGNGKEGYERALELKPQMIISDIMMPEMDGIEMLRSLRENFETSHIPVILLTAKSSVESRVEGLKFGADAYMTKPFNSRHLKAQISNILEQRKNLIGKLSGSVTMSGFTDHDMVVTDNDSLFLKRVFEIIEENLSDPDFKIELITRAVGMGRTNFFEKLKGLTNLSPIDLIKEYRLHKALLFLDSGKYTISEVSFNAGFHDQGYFSRCFKEKFGKSPSQYLKEKSAEEG